MNKLPFETIKREQLIRKDILIAKEDRSVEELIKYGIVNIDKPRGPTSHQVSDYVQRILNISKSGHSGTLDPNVTGVLPIALEKATRIVQVLLPAGKEYVGIMHLHHKIDEEKIHETLKKFEGKIKQLPPIKSSVKRQWRERNIYYIKVLEIIEQDILFKIGCQAGTYIRKFCHDFGKELGIGAHMSELRRTKASSFDESTLVTLQDLSDAFYYYKQGNEKYLRHCIQPVENALAHIPKIWVFESAEGSLSHGIDLKIPGIIKLESEIQKDDTIAILSHKNQLIALGEAKLSSEEMLGEKGVAVKVKKVFI